MAPSAPITPRRPRFEYPDDFDPMWTPARPEFACAANAVSLMMPIIEPYFVRTIAGAVPELDPDLADATEGYLAQERAHHGAHHRFNRLLVARYPRLGPVERLLGWSYGLLERRASARFNLAVVTVSETMAYSAARWAADHRTELFDGADPTAAALYWWHLAEEVEHKASAHEVHRAIEAGRRWWRLRLLAAMVVALVLVMVFVAIGTTTMVAAERRLHHPVAWLRLVRWSVTFAFELLANLALSLRAGHHPDDLVDPLWYEVWLRDLDDAPATSNPVAASP
ncbi:MAG: metal-dependent hydrolase [Actinomycetota bacterium]